MTMHVDQFSKGGAELAVSLGCVSADHLEQTQDEAQYVLETRIRLPWLYRVHHLGWVCNSLLLELYWITTLLLLLPPIGIPDQLLWAILNSGRTFRSITKINDSRNIGGHYVSRRLCTSTACGHHRKRKRSKGYHFRNRRLPQYFLSPRTTSTTLYHHWERLQHL